MKLLLISAILIYSVLLSIPANSFTLLAENLQWLWLVIPLFLVVNLFAGFFITKTRFKRIRACSHGNVLLASFLLVIPISVAYHIVLAFYTIPDDYTTFLWSILLCTGVETIIFWNGIICLYMTSFQIGMKYRIIGIICGLIPGLNVIALSVILFKTFNEVFVELDKEKLNKSRKEQKVCQTKYPVLMVHGVMFRDFKYLNYWGRIPSELETNGAKIFYGNHHSASSVHASAEELTERIKTIVNETGCEKVNIIAHSKGGLDCRYAISNFDAAPYIASLTTINTPHNGCEFADYLLTKISPKLQNRVAKTYNGTLKRLGEPNSDFLAAMNNLTASACKQLNEELSIPEGIYCQSIGSVLVKAKSGKFPLNLSYRFVKHFDGPNDGLVSKKSFEWGEKFTLVEPKKKCGISHADIIDLNRENIRGFDVREFYVELVNDLKERGL
ncbi:MAG: triacylglycerol lipase [Ruminococcaceae bacterium]|nr:triacylglycerol lipase [Oscillospiraceae bacterium]